MILRNIYQYQSEQPFKGESIDYKTSKTVPDQSLSIMEIMKRYASGIPLDEVAHPVYYDGIDGQVDENNVDITARPDFDLADVTEQLNEISSNQQVTKAAREAKRKEKERSDADALKAKLKAEVLAELEKSTKVDDIAK